MIQKKRVLIMDKKLNIAIVGLGNRGKHCFGGLLKQRSDCRVAALCDTNRHRAELVVDVHNAHQSGAFVDCVGYLQRRNIARSIGYKADDLLSGFFQCVKRGNTAYGQTVFTDRKVFTAGDFRVTLTAFEDQYAVFQLGTILQPE